MAPQLTALAYLTEGPGSLSTHMADPNHLRLYFLGI